jgi:hypothetical protein
MLRYWLHRKACSEVGSGEGTDSLNRILAARFTWRSKKEGKVSG